MEQSSKLRFIPFQTSKSRIKPHRKGIGPLLRGTQSMEQSSKLRFIPVQTSKSRINPHRK